MSIKKYSKMLTCALVLISLQGCVALQVISSVSSIASVVYAKKAGEAVSSSGCSWTAPIYLDGDVEGLTDGDLKQIVTHNEVRDRICEER